jgi:hypothetical protein
MREVCRWSLWLYKNLVQFLWKKILCFLLHYSWFKIWVLLYVICSSNFIFRSGLSRRCSVRIFLRSLILAHSSCCPRFGFCLVSPCRSEPVQVFFCLKLIFLLWFLREYCYRPVFLLSTDFSWAQHLGFVFLGPRASTSGWLVGRVRRFVFTKWFFLLSPVTGRPALPLGCFAAVRATKWPSKFVFRLLFPPRGTVASFNSCSITVTGARS